MFPGQGPPPHLVFLGVPNEAELRSWLKVGESFFDAAAFHEPDLNDSLTAVAFPGVTTDRRRLFSKLKLVSLPEGRTMTTHKSRFGFHSCSYETFRKLKRLNFLGLAALRRSAEWERWNRKLPQNRKRYVGGKEGYEGVKKNNVPKSHRVYVPWTEPDTFYMSDRELVLEDSRNARRPVEKETDVKPLKMSEAAIDKLLAEMEKWYVKTPVKAEPTTV